jgi:hypothetical protein
MVVYHYVPFLSMRVDDPTLTTGKHLTMLPIPGHRIAVLHFVKKKELKVCWECVCVCVLCMYV